MSLALPIALPPRARLGRVEPLLSALAGLGASALIFIGLSLMQRPAATGPATMLDEIQSVALPVEPPPPLTKTEELPPLQSNNLIQLEEAHSESVVKLPAVPILVDTVPPVAGTPHFDFTPTAVKPNNVDTEFDNRHVYTRTEVDQRCVALLKTKPDYTKEMLRSAEVLRVTFLFIVNRDGSVENVQLATSSGSQELDAVSAEAIRQWKFSPAMRKGKKVRQWVQQALVFRLRSTSPFESP